MCCELCFELVGLVGLAWFGLLGLLVLVDLVFLLFCRCFSGVILMFGVLVLRRDDNCVSSV